MKRVKARFIRQEKQFLGEIGMKNTVFVKAAALLLLLAGLTVSASAQITVSGGFALSQLDPSGTQFSGVDVDIGIGGNVYVDYLLPLSIPLSVGGEIGVDGANLSVGSLEDTITVIPVLARVAYHFDLMPTLDLYVVGKLGIVFGSWEGDVYDAVKGSGAKIDIPAAIVFGFDVGASYYFTTTIGAFAEVGFDRYNLEAKASGGGMSSTLEMPFNRFVTFGISVKF
jgi:hypothetical protein